MSFRSITIGIALGLSLSSPVQAACTVSPGAAEVLTWRPISHYVEQVIARADNGIRIASAAPGVSDALDSTFFQWIADVSSTVLAMIDTEMRQVEYERNLKENTACLHIDLRILEAKMEEVRCELREAVDRGSFTGIFRLQSLLGFLNARYRALTMGATDPRYTDEKWQNWYIFDGSQEVVCCDHFSLECTKMDALECKSSGFKDYPNMETCLAKSDPCFLEGESTAKEELPKLCPFSSDYWVPTVLLTESSAGVSAKAYGCDIDALEQKGHHTKGSTATDEYNAMKAFKGERDELLKTGNIGHIKEAYETIQKFAGKEIDPNIEYFGRTVDAEHDRTFNCEATLPPNAVFLDLRGPFNYRKDHISILKEYFNLTQKWALERTFGDPYKITSEIKDEEKREEAKEREKEGLHSLGIINLFRKTFREGATDDSLRQAVAETAIIPKSSDMQLIILEKMKPLRTAMKGIYKNVASPTAGFRGFAKNYALFLRSSCIYRPCSERLENILKIIYSDKCFPYASGEFTKKLNPEYLTCMEDAKDSAYCEGVHGKFTPGSGWKECLSEVNAK